MDASDLTGVYTYRSFRNDDDPGKDVNALLFGMGELTLVVSRDGTVTGTLAFPADPFAEEKDFMDLAGSVTSWSPLGLKLTGKGRKKTEIFDFEYDYSLMLAEQWAGANNQRQTLVGTVLRAKDHGTPPNVAKAGVTASVMAVRRTFIEPRDVKEVGLLADALSMLASKQHRLEHAVWHTLRAVWWDPLNDDDRAAIAAKGWDVKRPPRTKAGSLDLTNGAGEDFLFMHRQMIAMVADAYAKAGKPMIAPWDNLPVPATPQVVYASKVATEDPNLVTFVRDASASGVAVPVASSDDERWVKSPEYFASVMRPLSQMFRQPRQLATMSLGALGNLLEMTIHNAMHMRWASVARNPRTGETAQRDDFDFGDDWNDPRYDYLGEFYSSHVNPVFWHLHGWVDARIEDWFAAQEAAYPGRIKRRVLNGVQWFALEAPWVQVEAPFSGMGGISMGHHHHGPDHVQSMLDVMAIIKAAAERPSPTAKLGTPRGTRRLMSFATWTPLDGLALQSLIG